MRGHPSYCLRILILYGINLYKYDEKKIKNKYNLAWWNTVSPIWMIIDFEGHMPVPHFYQNFIL